MTREKAIDSISIDYIDNYNDCSEYVLEENVYSLISEIYDDFDSRVCENCKYSSPMGGVDDSPFISCSKTIRMDLYMQHNTKDFGCNKFKPGE